MILLAYLAGVAVAAPIFYLAGKTAGQLDSKPWDPPSPRRLEEWN